MTEVPLPTSAKAAKEGGFTRYCTGKPCKRGHISPRKTRTSNCVACCYLTVKEYNARPERRAACKAYIQRHFDKNPTHAWAVRTVNGAKSRARKAGVPFDIDTAYVTTLAREFCPALGIKLVYWNRTGGGGSPTSASMDRIRPELGYVRGNLAVISHRANLIKADAPSAEEVFSVARWLESVLRQ